MSNSKPVHWSIKIVLFLLICIGGFLRFYNINWDEGNMFHPDERNIANAVSRISLWDQLDPGFFAYGGLTIYLYKVTGDGVSYIKDDVGWTSDWGKINIIGRYYSAFFSTITILTLFILARKLFNDQIAILSSFIFAFTVFSIQSAHYATTESVLGLFATSIALTSLWIFKKPSLLSYLVTGIILGLAVASKTSALAFLAFPITASFFVFVKHKISFMTLTALCIVMFSSALSVFSIFSPYTFLSSQKFIESMEYENGVVKGTLPVPYTLQFTKTLPYIFQLTNLFWQMGLVAFFAILGTILICVRAVQKREISLLIILSFPLAYFLYVGGWHTKFVRYMAPLLPFFSVFAAYVIWRIYTKNRLAGEVVITLVAFFTVAWALAFFTIYTRPQTRIVASEWIYQNVPAGSRIFGEHWDDGLPTALVGYNPGQYIGEALSIYDEDNDQKLEYYATKLSSADYIFLSSRRLYGTLIYLPEKYPLTKKYYTYLFSGQLGFEKVGEFTSYPTLLGITINDDFSEESFQVYEHPKVLIFKNKDRLSYQTVKSVLTH